MKTVSIPSKGLLLSTLLVLDFSARLDTLLKNMVTDYRGLITLRSVPSGHHTTGFDRVFVDTQEIFGMSSP